jgi:hypothetical protein
MGWGRRLGEKGGGDRGEKILDVEVPKRGVGAEGTRR